MSVKMVIDGNAVYEMDEECLECQKKQLNYEEKDTDRTEQRSKKKNTPSV